MAISPELMQYLLGHFNSGYTPLPHDPTALVPLATEYGMPVYYNYNMETGGHDPIFDKGGQLIRDEWLRRQFAQHVPQDLRDALAQDAVNPFVGSDKNWWGTNPATGQIEPWYHNEEMDASGVGIPKSIADRYPELRLSPSIWKSPEYLAGDDLGIGEYVPLAIMAAAGAHFAGLPGFGLETAAAEAAGAGAFDAAGMAGLESGFGIGGAGMGGSAGLTFPVGAYDPANPLVFGGGSVDGLSLGTSLGSPGNPGTYLTGATPFQSTGSVYLDQYLTGSLGSSSSVPRAVAGGSQIMPPSGSKSFIDSIKETGKEIAPYAPLMGMASGGLAGAAGGSGKAGAITVEEGIPDWLMPYVKPQLDKYSAQVQNYNVDPYGVMPAAMQEFKNTISGQYLDPSTNRWLEEYYKLGAERVKGNLSPSFGHMQAFGSHSGYNEALSRGLSDLAVGLYGGAYENERNRQNQMISAAPNFLTQSTTSAFAPYNQYLSTVGSLGKKKDQPYFEPSAMQNILGGAMMGYGLGSIFK